MVPAGPRASAPHGIQEHLASLCALDMSSRHVQVTGSSPVSPSLAPRSATCIRSGRSRVWVDSLGGIEKDRAADRRCALGGSDVGRIPVYATARPAHPVRGCDWCGDRRRRGRCGDACCRASLEAKPQQAAILNRITPKRLRLQAHGFEGFVPRPVGLDHGDHAVVSVSHYVCPPTVRLNLIPAFRDYVSRASTSSRAGSADVGRFLSDTNRLGGLDVDRLGTLVPGL